MNRDSDKHANISPLLEDSPRFARGASRRDFLGLAAIWSAVMTVVVAAVGSLRLPMPAVFPESNAKVRIGPPDKFPPGGPPTHLPDLSIWVFRDDDGAIYAISSICTHLGCIASRLDDGEFLCPCHGSRFASRGKVLAGPAPSPLHWLELTVAPDGQVVVNKTRNVRLGTKLMV